MWSLPACCFAFMAAVTLAVTVGDVMNSVRSSGLTMREYHLPLLCAQSLVKKIHARAFSRSALTDSFFWPYGPSYVPRADDFQSYSRFHPTYSGPFSENFPGHGVF